MVMKPTVGVVKVGVSSTCSKQDWDAFDAALIGQAKKRSSQPRWKKWFPKDEFNQSRILHLNDKSALYVFGSQNWNSTTGTLSLPSWYSARTIFGAQTGGHKGSNAIDSVALSTFKKHLERQSFPKNTLIKVSLHSFTYDVTKPPDPQTLLIAKQEGGQLNKKEHDSIVKLVGQQYDVASRIAGLANAASNGTPAQQVNLFLTSLSQVRKFQDKFRKQLMMSPACWVLSANIPQVLVASHIVSVSECLKSNRLNDITDPNNGLLLSATIDRLFDSKLISFNQTGEILASTTAAQHLTSLGVPKGSKLTCSLPAARKKFLSEHETSFKNTHKKQWQVW